MTTKVTHGIKISVDTKFQEGHSYPSQRYFLFLYKITIENTSDYTVQLLRRHWDIFDSSGEYRAVDGEGVVGKQPVLEPGQSFTYESACNLATDIGRMSGYYVFQRQVDNSSHKVTIPEFNLVVPERLN